MIRRAAVVVAAALLIASACSHGTTRTASPTTQTAAATTTSTFPGEMPTTTYLPHPPYLSGATHLRLLFPQDGLELVDLDAGTHRQLVPTSDDNGDYWTFERVAGGVLAQGRAGGSGAGSVELTSWFIPNGQAPTAQRLGTATDTIDDPRGGVWLVDLPQNNAGFGEGDITLVDTHGGVRQRGHVTCCQRPLVPVGGNRFVMERENDQAIRTLDLVDVAQPHRIRQLTPTGRDAEFVRVEKGAAVWTDDQCKPKCVEHVVDLATGATHDQPAREGLRSPDGSHNATPPFPDDGALAVDGRPLANGEHDGRRGLEWSPDSRFLLFVRPDTRHFGIWRVGDPEAQTVAADFSYLEEWVVFDQRG